MGNATWIPLRGVWGIISNSAYTPTTTSDAAVIINTGLTNHYAEATLNGALNVGCGLVVRAVNNSNYLVMTCPVASTIQVYKKVAGAFTQMLNTGVSSVLGSTYRISVNDTNVNIYRDGSLIGGFTDNSGLLGTGVGLRTDNNATLFNNFSASSS